MPESVGLVAGLDDVAVVGQPVEQCGGHLEIAKDLPPFAESEIGGDDQAGLLVQDLAKTAVSDSDQQDVAYLKSILLK